MDGATVQQIHDECNRVRAAHGLPALTLDAELCRESQAWAERMAATGQFRHGGGEEIIAWATWRQTAVEVIATWMSSRGHRAWILSRSAAAGWGEAQGRGKWYWSGSFDGAPDSVPGNAAPSPGVAPPKRPWWRVFLPWAAALLACCGATARVCAQDQLEFPPEVRAWFRNPYGSCVQCSIGMCGVWQNQPKATTLLWDSQYGSRVRGGSSPSRVENYCDRRQIPVYNVTGDVTWDWMKWTAKTGRMAAIGAGGSHFQTLCWWDSTSQRWYVCNNNSPTKIDEYTWTEFRRLHLASGEWVVILKTPAPPAYPSYVRWW